MINEVMLAYIVIAFTSLLIVELATRIIRRAWFFFDGPDMESFDDDDLGGPGPTPPPDPWADQSSLLLQHRMAIYEGLLRGTEQLFTDGDPRWKGINTIGLAR